MSVHEERGFALVSVLWAAMILAAIIAGILAIAHSAALLADTHYTETRLAAIDDAAINLVILRLLAPDRAVHPPADGTPFAVAFAGDNVTLRTMDEAGKIDLNMAQEQLLRELLVVAGLDPDSAQQQVDKIIDWREGSIGRRLNGAKAPDYRVAGFSYGPRGGPFASVAELQLVLGMTPALYGWLTPCLTVYSQSPWVDPTFAPLPVLEALRKLDGPGISAVMADRANGAANSATLGHAFTIEAETSGPGGLRVARRAVIRLTGSPAAPLAVYQWQ